MTDKDRIKDLARRVRDIEIWMEKMETAPPSSVGEWLENAERFAFTLLLVKLEGTVPGFSIAAFREDFLRMQIDILDSSFGSADAERSLRDFIEKRVRELATELIPRSAYDEELP